jgi:hypothetical protein
MQFLKRLFRRKPKSASTPEQEPASATQRLAEAFAVIQNLELERAVRADPLYRKDEEDLIIWRELFDLEMQQLHEHFGRR